jgi:hypothetical protein
MSRRIFFVPVLIALIWSGALIATKAIADRECFEDSCRETEAAELKSAEPKSAEPKSAESRSAEPKSTESRSTEAASAAAKSEEPQVAADPQPAQAQAAQAQAAQAQAEPSRTQVAAPQVSAVSEIAPPEIPMTVVSEPAVSAAPAPAPAPAPASAPAARAEGKLMPASVLPKVVAEPPLPRVASEPAPRAMPPQVSTRAEEARIRREPPRLAPNHAETRKPAPVATPAPAPVAAPSAPPARAVNIAVPAYVRPERPPQPATIPSAVQTLPSDYVVRQQRLSTTTAAIVEVPGEIATADGVVTVHPNLRHDPAWKLCQIDSRDLGRRAYRCTAYSYQPYGEGGYRPYGTYRHYQATPGYVVAPNAKIISIDPND